MTLPTTVDWTPRYLAVLPPKWETDAGTCWACTALSLIELRGILLGQPVVQLSQLFAAWNANPNPGTAEGGFVMNGLYGARFLGVCAEKLWPITLAYGPQTASAGISDYAATELALNTKPSDAAYADAPNHKTVDFGPFRYDGTRVDKILQIQTAIAAGYPMSCFLPPEHSLPVFGYDQTGVIGLDMRSGSRQPFHYLYDEIGVEGEWIVRDVLFTGQTSYPTIFPAYGFPTATPVQPSPTPAPPSTGNTQMLIDNYKALVNALALGQITSAQLAAIDAARVQIVPDAVAPPVVPPVAPPAVPPPAGTSAAGATTPPLPSVTDNLAAVWTRGATQNVLRNGADAKGFYAAQILWTGVRIEAQNKDNGSWSFWNGNGWTWTGR